VYAAEGGRTVKIGSVVKVVLGLAIAAAGVTVFLHQVNIREMVGEVSRTPLWKIAIVAALNPATLLFRAWRWRFLLADRPGSVKRDLFALVTIGFMVNNFFPARIGEAARAALLWKRNHFTLAQSIGSLIVERLLDVLVFAIFLFVPIIVLPQLASLRPYGLLLGAGVLVAVLCFAAYAWMPNATGNIGAALLKVAPARLRGTISKIAGEIVSNLDWVFSPAKCAMVILLSFVTLFCQIAMLQILGLGIAGFDVFVSMYGIAFAAIGAAIPLAPGYVGTLHAMMLSGMGMAGIGPDKAGALAILYHAIGYVMISIMGLYYFFSLKISMKDIRRGSVQAERDQTAGASSSADKGDSSQ
jgi:uncharacterized protein (TIRG00374 family)